MHSTYGKHQTRVSTDSVNQHYSEDTSAQDGYRTVQLLIIGIVQLAQAIIGLLQLHVILTNDLCGIKE